MKTKDFDSREPVVQEDGLGCAVASTAFVLNIPYQEAITLFEDGQRRAKGIPNFYCPEIVKILKENATSILDKEPEIGPAGPWCDAHFLINKGILTICGFGPDGENQHAINEFVYTNSIIQVCKIYALTAFDFLK